MKSTSIRFLYHISDFLTDKTKGFPLFANWKIALGGILLGTTVISCGQKNTDNNVVAEKDSSKVIPDTMQIICYKPAAPKDIVKYITPIKNIHVEDSLVTMCYMIMKDSISLTIEDSLTEPSPPPEHNDSIYRFAEVKASFPEGGRALANFIKKELVYPATAKQEGIQGRVIVRFVVLADGEIKDIEVKKSTNEILDAEAIRVIKNMPKWIPAQHRGKPVASYFTQPIDFTLR